MPGSRNGGGFARDVVLEFAEHAADGEFLGKSEFNAKVQRREVAKKNNPRFASLRLCAFALKSVPAPAGLGNLVAWVAAKISLLTELRSAGLRPAAASPV